MSKFILTIPGKPVPMGRPRVTMKRGKTWTYNPAECEQYKKKIKTFALKWAVKNNWFPVAKPDAVKMEVHVRLDRPKSIKRSLPTVTPDLDNFLKIVMDALNNITYEDDGQVCLIGCSKKYCKIDEKPHVEVVVERVV